MTSGACSRYLKIFFLQEKGEKTDYYLGVSFYKKDCDYKPNKIIIINSKKTQQKISAGPVGDLIATFFSSSSFF